jgi:hypothetical protein
MLSATLPVEDSLVSARNSARYSWRKMRSFQSPVEDSLVSAGVRSLQLPSLLELSFQSPVEDSLVSAFGLNNNLTPIDTRFQSPVERVGQRFLAVTFERNRD